MFLLQVRNLLGHKAATLGTKRKTLKESYINYYTVIPTGVLCREEVIRLAVASVSSMEGQNAILSAIIVINLLNV